MKEINLQLDVERAWKDQAYRNSLTPEQLKILPSNPAGEIELSEAELDSVAGGGTTTGGTGTTSTEMQRHFNLI